jgi:hypothetical protein
MDRSAQVLASAMWMQPQLTKGEIEFHQSLKRFKKQVRALLHAVGVRCEEGTHVNRHCTGGSGWLR